MVSAAAACVGPPGATERLSGVPGVESAADRGAWEARRLFEAGQHREARSLVEEVLGEAPEHVDAHRVRQDILRGRGRMGLLLSESERRLELAPGDPASHYLAGRIARTSDQKLANFIQATELDPGFFWGWFGRAFVERSRDPERAREIYEELYAGSDGHPLAAISLASVLRGVSSSALGYPADRDRFDDALQLYEELRGHPLAPGVGDLGCAQVHYQRDRIPEAWASLMRAAELRPFDAGVHGLVNGLLGRGLSASRLHQLLDTLSRDPARSEQFVASGGGAVYARVLDQVGQGFDAREVLRGAGGAGPDDPGPRRLWQRLQLQTGDVRGFLRGLRRGYPVSLLDDDRNLVRDRFARLFTGPWMDRPDPLASGAEAVELAGALMSAGYVEEAGQVCAMALLRHADSDSLERLRGLREEARRQVSFERVIRRMVYRGYLESGESSGLDGLLADLRRASVEIFGEDVVGVPARHRVPLVGQLLDPFGGGLFDHLGRYNRHLVLGQRAGAAPEAMMLRRLSVRQLEANDALPLPRPAMEVVGEDRSIRAIGGVYGGDLAGVALLDHTVIDMDAVREWAGEIRARRRIVNEDHAAQMSDPLPRGGDWLQPAGVHWRLSMVSPAEDSELDLAVLDMIRWHERAHLVDAMYFLPVSENLWRIARLLVGHGFNRASIEAEIEARAEVAALALSSHPRLVLAHVAGFLEGDAGGSPHAVGFRRMAERLGNLLRQAGVPSEVRGWDRLDPEVVRRLGRELLRSQW